MKVENWRKRHFFVPELTANLSPWSSQSHPCGELSTAWGRSRRRRSLPGWSHRDHRGRPSWDFVDLKQTNSIKRQLHTLDIRAARSSANQRVTLSNSFKRYHFCSRVAEVYNPRLGLSGLSGGNIWWDFALGCSCIPVSHSAGCTCYFPSRAQPLKTTAPRTAGLGRPHSRVHTKLNCKTKDKDKNKDKDKYKYKYKDNSFNKGCTQN